jgi:drug/metabolite transporter (DMT)-like permease
MSKGILYMLIASIAFGFMNLSVKMIGHMHVSQVVFFRAVVQIVLGLAVLIQQRQSPFGKNPKMLFMRGFFGSMGLLCYFYTLQKMPLGNAIVIHYLSPILTTLLALALGDEIVKPRQWLFFGLSFLGVVVVNGLSSQVTWFGILAGLGGAVFSAFAYNTIRRLKGIENPNVVVFYFPLVTLPMSLLYPAFITDAWRMPIHNEWFWLLVTGVATQIGQFFMTRAYQEDATSRVSAISYAGVIWATAVGVFIFAESYSIWQFVGIALVLMGMILNLIFTKSSPSKT